MKKQPYATQTDACPENRRTAAISRRLWLALMSSAAIVGPGLSTATAQATRDWSDDPFFGEPEIDTDEWRTKPTRHRYIHGRFAGTGTRFAIALPEAPVYSGRFMQFLQGGLGGNELTGYGRESHQIAFDQGAYYVESNQGHVGNDMSGLAGDMTILEWRASAQTARFARSLAQAMYGAAPHHGYIMGGSGGGMCSIDCIENAPDIWNGAVPFMINRAGLMPFNWSLTAWASVILEQKLPALSQAARTGADPFSVVTTADERSALDALYRSGFPRRAEDQLGPNPLWILGMQTAIAADARYFLDFWTEPGYEGKDATPEVKALTLDFQTEVQAVLTGDEVAASFQADPDSEITGAMRSGFGGKGPAAIRIKGDVPATRLLGSSLQFETGAAAGQRIMCTGSIAGALAANLDARGFADVRPGDRLRVTNRNLLAYMFFHRHAVDQRHIGMQQFFDGGKPRHVQRKIDFNAFRTPKAKFRGKMILLQHLLDRDAFPTSVDLYARGVRENLGAAADDSFRLWWTDNAQHGVPADARTRYIDYRDICSQAFADVIVWVENGKEPPASTQYAFDETSQVVMPARASDRLGVQPTIAFTVNGQSSAKLELGATAKLRASVQAPPGAGRIVLIAYDFDGSGNFATPHAIAGAPAVSYVAETVHVFDKPGEHVITIKVASERTGNSKGYLVQNIARVTVTVA
ncbi:MAG: tannase/feruloyl esterase family alpha/beta hydrolase [Alphaproteobacteria bacterium]|nr:tannase/feruloyl esterase family alpha/beta hydrolase [Alphaproteobacteria bacterium]